MKNGWDNIKTHIRQRLAKKRMDIIRVFFITELYLCWKTIILPAARQFPYFFLKETYKLKLYVAFPVCSFNQLCSWHDQLTIALHVEKTAGIFLISRSKRGKRPHYYFSLFFSWVDRPQKLNHLACDLGGAWILNEIKFTTVKIMSAAISTMSINKSISRWRSYFIMYAVFMTANDKTRARFFLSTVDTLNSQY